MKKIKSWLFILIIILNAVLITLIVYSRPYLFNYGYNYNNFAKVEQTMTLSKNKKNVIYIMLDMTTGFDVTSILQGNSYLANNFTGFTNYQNLITTSWGTNGSVPSIFGGYDYNVFEKNHNPLLKNLTLKEYMKKAMNVLISAFGENKQWDISCVANQYYDYNENKSYWDSNWKTLENDFKQYNVQAINAPDITRLIATKYPELYKSLNLPENIYTKSTNINYIAISSYLSHVAIKETEKNKFMTIMDESHHVPIVMDQLGNYKKEIPLNSESVYQSTMGFLNKINNFITYLKENNIYDNTMIIINSDHGNAIGSLAISNPEKYNYSGINYSDIAKITTKYQGFSRGFPTLLIKSFNNNNQLSFDNKNLYTNTDTLSFIKEYNKDEVKFNKLDETRDKKRYLQQLSEVEKRKDIYMASYHNDSLWNDQFTKYLTPDSGFGGNSFLVKNSIYNINNFLVNKNRKDYYSPEIDIANNWETISL